MTGAAERGARSATIPPMQRIDPEHDPRIKWLPAAEIRKRYLDYFEERGHTMVPSSSSTRTDRK